MTTLSAVRTSGVPGESRLALLYVAAAASVRQGVVDRLQRLRVPMVAVVDSAHALRVLAARSVTLAIVDLVGNRAALAAIRTILAKHPRVFVAAVADPSNPLIAGEAVQAGALDLVSWPFEDRDVLTILSNARDLAVTDSTNRPEGSGRVDDWLVDQSSTMRAVAEHIRSVAKTRTGLFIAGEPGTGRTFIARLLHESGQAAGDRNSAPFVFEDCAQGAVADVEHALFGVAEERKHGGRAAAFDRVSQSSALYRARGGTLFLKNLLEAPARVQTRLLRLLRDREAELVEQPGTFVDLDVRLVASVDPTVDEAVADGRMRPDLYDRLAHARIDLPPLRRRREDIPVLAVLFLRRACEEQAVPPKGISRSALKLLSALPWLGNAGELRMLIDTLVHAVEQPVIQLDDLLEHASFETAAVRVDAGVSLRDAKARFERECISAVLARHHGRVGDAAKALGIQRTNLYRKVRQLQVNRPRRVRKSG